MSRQQLDNLAKIDKLKREPAEYEGDVDVDEQLVAATIRVAQQVAKRVSELVSG